MTRRRWKARQPTTPQDAMRLCLDWADFKHNRSVARVGDLMGVSEWTVYKWMSEGSIPSRRIRPFEFACGATFLTQYIAISAQKIIIDIPAGRACDESGLLDLQNVLNDAVSLLTRFYRGEIEAGDVLQGATSAIEQLAGHRENVRKHAAPELDLFSEGDE